MAVIYITSRSNLSFLFDHWNRANKHKWLHLSCEEEEEEEEEEVEEEEEEEEEEEKKAKKKSISISVPY